MTYKEIKNPDEWRISMSGFSIKTGWGDDEKIIAKYPYSTSNLDGKKFEEWIDNAEVICALYNKSIS